MSDRNYIVEEHDHLALLLRLQALSEDWYRLRDIERQWQTCSRWAMRALFVVLIAAALTACDSREKQCGRWTAAAQFYEDCAITTQCRSNLDVIHYREWQKARIERTRWCPKEAT